MKKYFIISTLLVAITGCGVFDKKNLNNEKLLTEEEHVDYNGTGKYDLSNYIFPNKSDSLVYSIAKYRKGANDKNFDFKNPISINNNKIEEYVYSDNRVLLNKNIEYLIGTNYIQKKELIGDFYDVRKFRRFLNETDVYYSYEQVDLKNSYRRAGKTVCKVVKHLPSQKIKDIDYNDVLHLNCIGDYKEAVINNSFSKKKDFQINSFYAKDIGLIGEISERCEDTVTGIQRNKECTRIEKTLIK